MLSKSDLTPLPKGDIKLGEPLKFPIYDADGQLLLASGQTVASGKQLEELSSKGLFFNPLWASNLVNSRANAGTVAPTVNKSFVRKQQEEDPSESGRSMKMSVPGTEESFIVRLIGDMGKDAFLVTHPMRDSSYVFVKEGQSWEFRAFYGTSIHRFSSQVLKVFLAPYPMLVMSWPNHTAMESRVIRGARRATCEIPASLRRMDGINEETLCHGIISNLSTGGCELQAAAGVKSKKGEELILVCQLALAGKKFLLRINSKVMSVGNADDETRLGLAFMDLPDRDLALVHGYVMDRLLLKVESPLLKG